jgi:purine-nucleoside phosphorylase
LSYIAPSAVIDAILAQNPQRTRRHALPAVLVVAFDGVVFNGLRRGLRARRLAGWLYDDRPNRRLYIAADGNTAVMRVEIGAPALVYLLEILAACGVETVLLTTSAGSVGGLEVGDLFLIGEAYSENGVTDAYAPGRRVFCADPELAERLELSALSVGLIARPAQSLSCDAFFRDRPRFWIKPGFAADIVEMEAAAAYCLAELRGVRACAIGHVSDGLDRSWNLDYRAQAAGKRNVVRVVLAYLSRAIPKPSR